MTKVVLAIAIAVFVSGQARAELALLPKSDNSPGSAPDAGLITRIINFGLSDISGTNGLITDVNVDIQFSRNGTTATLPRFDQIQFLLRSPTGTEITLIDGIPQSSYGQGTTVAADTFNGTISFDQSAAGSIRGLFRPIAGTWRPDSTDDALNPTGLNAFNGLSVLGDWTLTIEDTGAGGVPLNYQAFTLNVTAAVPEPSALSLLGISIFTVAMRRRRS
jgi:hypothetical protein